MTLANISAIVSELISLDKQYISILSTISKLRSWSIKDADWSGIHMNTLVDKGIIVFDRTTGMFTFSDGIDPRLIADEVKKLTPPPQLTITEPEPKHVQTLLTPELTAEFERLVSTEKDLLSYWALRLNPRLIGMEKERQGCLISLASPKDRQGIRRRAHTLIWGPPGTAKSILIQYIKYHLDAIGTGPTSSEAGLKMDARGSGTAGKLMMAHNKTLVIEEVDKFDKRSLESLYESMTTGEFEVDKGDIRETCSAAIRAIAVGNNIDKLPAPLIDRFDMIFYVEIPSKDAEKKITDDLYLQWITSKEDYRGEKLRAYLEWIKDYEPTITPDVMDKCMRLKNAYIDFTEKKPNVREKEAFLRVAFVVAKINHRDLCLSDFLQAIKLVDLSFNGTKINALELLCKELSK